MFPSKPTAKSGDDTRIGVEPEEWGVHAQSRFASAHGGCESALNHRRPTIPFTDAPRGTCRWCGESILHDSGAKSGSLNRRRRWHPACVATYNATDPRELRRRVRRRDRRHVGAHASQGVRAASLALGTRPQGSPDRRRYSRSLEPADPLCSVSPQEECSRAQRTSRTSPRARERCVVGRWAGVVRGAFEFPSQRCAKPFRDRASSERGRGFGRGFA